MSEHVGSGYLWIDQLVKSTTPTTPAPACTDKPGEKSVMIIEDGQGKTLHN
jgi:hypothetical protein